MTLVRELLTEEQVTARCGRAVFWRCYFAGLLLVIIGSAIWGLA